MKYDLILKPGDTLSVTVPDVVLPEPPEPPTPSATLVGAYVGNASSGIAPFEAKIGRKLQMIAAHGGRAGYADWNLGWLPGALTNPVKDRMLIRWSFPMVPERETDLKWQAGVEKQARFLAGHKAAAQTALAASPGSGPIYYRIGEEYNGTWMGWSSPFFAPAKVFKDAFSAASDVIRSVSPRFKIILCANYGQSDPEQCFPDPSKFDVIDMDVYFLTSEGGQNANAFEAMQSRAYGLNWLLAMGKKYSKPIGISEWGLDFNGPDVVAKMVNWCEANGALYHILWNEPGGRFSFDSKPKALAAYKAAVG